MARVTRIARSALCILSLAHCVRGTVIPMPSQAQLDYQGLEMVALTHFNMATFVADGDPACNPQNWNVSGQPGHFWPTNLNVSNWVESYMALGVHSAILTAKHGCGFFLWPTNVTLPNGSNYGYHVFGKGGIHRDVVAEFVEATSAAGLKHGFYFSVKDSFYLNVLGDVVQPNPIPGQVNLTQQQVDDVTLAALAELWGKYGQLSEIWFDGGIAPRVASRVRHLFNTLQPHTALFGAGINNSLNNLDWVGTESGLAQYPIWSTGCTSQEGGGSTGVPPENATDFCPKVSDVTLQSPDVWFYTPNVGIKSLPELIDIYHHTVGSNSVMEMDFAIDRTGNVAPDHAKRYKEFGDWIRTCYGAANRVAYADFQNANAFEVELQQPATIDRVMLQEKLKHGQLVMSYLIEVQTIASSGEWLLFGTGTSIGHKRIALVDDPFYWVMGLRVTTTSAAIPYLRMAAFGPCALGNETRMRRDVVTIMM